MPTSYQMQILEENQKNSDCDTLEEYCLSQALNDPSFFRWFFNNELLGDFGSGMSAEEDIEWNAFLASLK